MKSSEYDKEIIRLLRYQAKSAKESSNRVKGDYRYRIWEFKHKRYLEALNAIKAIEPFEMELLEQNKEFVKNKKYIRKPSKMDFS